MTVVAPAAIQVLDKTLAAAVTAEIHGPYNLGITPTGLVIFASFVRAAGGTDAKAWVQTSLDNGASWVDIANFAFLITSADRAYHLTPAAVTAIATPTDGSLADNTSVNGFLGRLFRVKLTTTGTYSGASSFKIWATPR